MSPFIILKEVYKMKTKSASKVNIFILKLTVVILIFALASLISVGFFVNAHNVAKKTTDTHTAMIKIQGLAEAFKSQDFFIDFTNLSGIEAIVSSENTVTGTLAFIHYTAFDLLKDKAPLYDLPVQKYFPDKTE